MQLTWETVLQQAEVHAQAGRFTEMLAACQQINESNNESPDALLSSGILLMGFGYLSRARICFERVQLLLPNDMRPLVNLANNASEAGDHAKSRRLYAALLELLPDNPIIRRNALVSLEYDPCVTTAERLAHAKEWGDWVIAQTGGQRPRPATPILQGRPLRVGYVSADFCQHTVGLFVKDVLEAHDPVRVTAIAYSAGRVSDWVTTAIQKACHFRDVPTFNDLEIAEQIRQDEIDVLVDLSGHTAGSRLTMFALRAAPIQVSWLGYFATTGLPYMDAVLLDQWHAPPGTEEQFVEQIVRLPMGRFCYQPVPWAPIEVAPAPCLRTGSITFGCFNNTSKLNEAVFDLWAQILTAVPDSRLVLKWRTFVDENLSSSVRAAFSLRGIARERIELRGASFHAEVLKQYADIDIALDPFPFTGGLTSCEALWMGVPVVTWAKSQVVSRQTFAFLSAIGMPKLAARSAEDYIRIAVELAEDRAGLDALRNGMRKRMQASPLMDVKGFASQLEDSLHHLYATIAEKEHTRL